MQEKNCELITFFSIDRVRNTTTFYKLIKSPVSQDLKFFVSKSALFFKNYHTLKVLEVS